LNLPRAFPVFATAFAVVYAVAYAISVKYNYALFTYHPALNEFGAGVQKAKTGPAMYWYGWMATAGIAAALAGLVASRLPESVTRRIGPCWSWAVPLVTMLFFCWMLKGYFLR
jgi:hypothetical protein